MIEVLQSDKVLFIDKTSYLKATPEQQAEVFVEYASVIAKGLAPSIEVFPKISSVSVDQLFKSLQTTPTLSALLLEEQGLTKEEAECLLKSATILQNFKKAPELPFDLIPEKEFNKKFVILTSRIKLSSDSSYYLTISFFFKLMRIYLRVLKEKTEFSRRMEVPGSVYHRDVTIFGRDTGLLKIGCQSFSRNEVLSALHYLVQNGHIFHYE